MMCIWAKLELVKFYRNFSRYSFEMLIRTLKELISKYPTNVLCLNSFDLIGCVVADLYTPF